MKLYVLDYGYGCGAVFTQLFSEIFLVNSEKDLPETFTKDTCFLFEGGTDISPELYGDIPHPTTQHSDLHRDVFEVSIFKRATEAGSPMIGICRGSQLLCAMSGGTLIQHVSDHGRNHSVLDYKERVYQVTSSHHQMMNPAGTNHQILAKSLANISKHYYIGGNKQVPMKVEPEVVWFPETKALAIQYHPEWMSGNSKAVQVCNEYVKEFIL
jgi:putative glutamine amidotransferase